MAAAAYFFHRLMRTIIPADVSKTNLPRLLSQGLPETVAKRVWTKKVLWLVCMHVDDVAKVWRFMYCNNKFLIYFAIILLCFLLLRIVCLILF